MRTTILAPYRPGEATWAALRLANHLFATGRDVRYVATTPVARGVHHFWDARVRAGGLGRRPRAGDRGHGVYRHTRGADEVVHFHPDPGIRRMAELVAPLARHVLVPLWHSLGGGDAALVLDHHAVVCPSVACARAVSESVFNGASPETTPLACAPFEPGFEPLRKEGLVEGGELHALVSLNRDAFRLRRTLAAVLDAVLGGLPRLRVTLAATRAFSGRDRHFRGLRLAHPGRVRFRTLGAAEDFTRLLHAHDWAVFFWRRADTTLPALHAMSCGVPVIAFDVAPFNEVVVPGNGGLLVPCKREVSRFGAETAVVDAAAAADCLRRAFADNGLLFRLQACDWPVAQAREGFVRAWNRALA